MHTRGSLDYVDFKNETIAVCREAGLSGVFQPESSVWTVVYSGQEMVNVSASLVHGDDVPGAFS